MDLNDHIYESTNPRESESPARTIDSVNSSSSMETIIDRSNREEALQSTLENSTNANNNYSKHSLTNSQISMISTDHKNEENTALDSQSHIYASPDFSNVPFSNKKTLEIEQPKLISHNEFQINMLESKAHKKQRIPPKLIEIQNPPKVAAKSGKPIKSFPIQIVLGSVQLVLSITLVALGGLLIVRDAALASTACGIWAGGVAAVTGALGVINLKKVKTAFLALSLICVATSTLALALSGIGLIRDINKLEGKFDPFNANAEISAASGLVLALFIHFVVSIVSVYQCALRLYSKSHEDPSNILKNNIFSANNASYLNQEYVNEYIKTLSKRGKENIMMSPEDSENLMAMWMYNTAKKNSTLQLSLRSAPVPTLSRPVRLIPAANGHAIPTNSGHSLGYPPYGSSVPPPPVVLHGRHIRGMTLPHMRHNERALYHDGSYRIPSNCSAIYSRPPSDINRRRQKLRKGKNDANRRQRRKSDTDAEHRIALTYTGLDRTIADNFLARQEQTIVGMGTGAMDTYKNGCRDVPM